MTNSRAAWLVLLSVLIRKGSGLALNGTWLLCKRPIFVRIVVIKMNNFVVSYHHFIVFIYIHLTVSPVVKQASN